MDSPVTLDMNLSHVRLMAIRKLLARLSTKHFKIVPVKPGIKKIFGTSDSGYL